MLYDSKKWGPKPPVNTDEFKTARQLGLKKAQYEALVKTLGRFELGLIPPLLFDMGVIGAPECGAAGCICGWARQEDHDLFLGWSDHPKLFKLFAPRSGHRAWAATPPQAAAAIRNFLTIGDPRWDEVMSVKSTNKE